MDKTDIKEIRRTSIQSTRESNNIIFSELLQIEKLKSTWIGQIITIASTIISGFAILSNKNDMFSLIGLLILFLTIVFGLQKIISNINSQINRLTETFEKQNDYAIKLNMLTYLEENKNNLTEEDNELKNKLEIDISNFNQELGIENELGEISNLSGKLPRDKITIGNYILIYGFASGGLLIIFSNKLIETFCN